MKLLDDIINEAVDDKFPLATVLRKCTVVAHQLKNETLKIWAAQELNGYETIDTLPDYRIVRSGARGLLLGPYGGQIPNQPIPASILDKKVRRYAEIIYVGQPIAALQLPIDQKQNDLRVPWPADLVARYQFKIIEGYSLNRAWQDLPSNSIAGILDTIRNRVLSFALELRAELPPNSDAAAIPTQTVERIVVNKIYGGVNIVGSSANNITQSGNHTNVTQGDFKSLESALEKCGLAQQDIVSLKHALADDKLMPGDGSKSLGSKTREWIQTAATKIGGEAAAETVAKIILIYLGISS